MMCSDVLTFDVSASLSLSHLCLTLSLSLSLSPPRFLARSRAHALSLSLSLSLSRARALISLSLSLSLSRPRSRCVGWCSVPLCAGQLCGGRLEGCGQGAYALGFPCFRHRLGLVALSLGALTHIPRTHTLYDICMHVCMQRESARARDIDRKIDR
jgi:hypothetical protein